MIRQMLFCAVSLGLTSGGEAAFDAGLPKGATTGFAVASPEKADRLVVYTASWCGPCRKLKPILHSLTEEGYRVDYLDVDKSRTDLEYSYSKVPTIFFVADDVVIRRETGYREKAVLESSLQRPTPQVR
ncbi:MAG: thioredoxin family protein [Planctomycetota bacterium]